MYQLSYYQCFQLANIACDNNSNSQSDRHHLLIACSKLHSMCDCSFLKSQRHEIYIYLDMWHSQILGSFEDKNINCPSLHENLYLSIEITKDLFPDDRKYKKVQKRRLKRLFAFSSHIVEMNLVNFHPLCAIWRVFQPYVVKSLN